MYFDVSLKLGSVMVVAGASGSGKTTFITKLLKEKHLHFSQIPQQINWHYGEIEPKLDMSGINLVKGLPDINDVKANSVIVIDDLFLEAAKNDSITNLFTRVSHHQNCFIIFITQNIFHQSSHNRTRNLNTQYLVLFKNPRDKLQITTLQRQMCMPHLLEAFQYATKSSFSYLMIDFRPETPDDLRLRTGILKGEQYLVFINKECEDLQDK